MAAKSGGRPYPALIIFPELGAAGHSLKCPAPDL